MMGDAAFVAPQGQVRNVQMVVQCAVKTLAQMLQGIEVRGEKC